MTEILAQALADPCEPATAGHWPLRARWAQPIKESWAASPVDPDQTTNVQWMFFTGMHPEEAIAVCGSDLDLRRQSVRVQRVRTFKGSERDGSKTHTERDVDLVPQALEALRTMRAYTLLRRAERAQEEDTEADVFQNPTTSRPWLMAGVPPACIASQLGNSVKMLLGRYARWIPGGDQGNARELLVAAMAAGPEGIRPRFVPTDISRAAHKVLDPQ
jgi:hypothetical protein